MVKYHVPWAPGRGGLHVHFGHHILSTFKYIAKSKVIENIFKSPFIVIIVELCLRNGKVGFEIYFFSDEFVCNAHVVHSIVYAM